MSRITCLATILSTCLLPNACRSSTAPSGDCEVTNNLEICIDRGQYAQGTTAAVTLTNRGTSVIRVDTCSRVLVERSTRITFGSSFNPNRRCGPEATAVEVAANMHVLAARGSVREPVSVPVGIPQGFYRVDYWLVDGLGALLSETPISSAEFDVFPSARP